MKIKPNLEESFAWKIIERTCGTKFSSSSIEEIYSTLIKFY